MTRHTVTAQAMRPLSTKQQCYYCHQPIGVEHKPDCMLVRKQVRVRSMVEYGVTVPAHWTPHDIEFYLNESSRCADNILDNLAELQKEHGCLCGLVKTAHVADVGEPYLEE